MIDSVKSSRNYGIDALRICAMFMVVILHILGQGGVLANAQEEKYAVSWLLEISAYCAVNCFALISGYVSFEERERPYKYHKYISVWLQVLFWGFGITLLAKVINNELVDNATLVKAMFPVSSSHYWYFNAYTGVFFLIPWFNKFVRNCEEQELNKFVITLFIMFVGYNTFARKLTDVFKLGNGYSFVWIAILYLVGAWMKKNKISKKIPNRYAMLGIFVCTITTWITKLYSLQISQQLISYVSPTIVLIGFFYVVIFEKLKFNSKQISWIKYFSPAAFGVYLIHVQNIVWNSFMKERFSWISQAKWFLIPILVIGCAIIIFVVCSICEKIRICIFNKLDINNKAERIAFGCSRYLCEKGKCILRGITKTVN